MFKLYTGLPHLGRLVVLLRKNLSTNSKPPEEDWHIGLVCNSSGVNF